MSLNSLPRRLLEPVSAALCWRLRVGIALQLCLAFVAVALFVLGANFVVVKSISIERTTTITRIMHPAVALTPIVVATSAIKLLPVPDVPPKIRLPNSDLFLSKLSETTHSVELRSERQGAAADEEYARSLRAFDRDYAAFLSDGVAAYGKAPMSRVDSAMSTYKQHGRQIVRSADERRALKTAYSAAFEELNREVKHSLEGAWT